MTDNENTTEPAWVFTDADGRIFMSINRDLTVTSALEDASEAGRAFIGSIRTELATTLHRSHAPTELERKLARAMARVEQLSDHLGIPYVYETGHGPVRPSAAPPAYLAADLWDALGAPTSDFDAYYERNRWADTWSNLLGAVRDRFRPKCGQDVEGESCVLTAGHLPPHYGPSDVGSSEPVPVAETPDPSTETIAAEDGLTLQDLGDAMIDASDHWDGDEAMHSIVLRFIRHYAEIDGLIYAARAEQDDDVVEPILFQWDDENFTLVRYTPAPQGEPTEAQIEAAHKAFWEGPDITGGHDAIRAALRAAGGVR